MAKRDSKTSTLMDFISSKGECVIHEKDLEAEYKQFAKNSGYNVRGFGRNISKNSLSSGVGYTRSLYKHNTDLQSMMDYDPKSHTYHIHGNSNGDDGPSFGEVAGSVLGGIGGAVSGPVTSGRENFVSILALILIVALLYGGVSLFRAGKVFVGKANSFLSAEYDAESFAYEGLKYIGNQRFNKPDGVCMRLDGQDYTIGYFEGSDLNGYGMVVKEHGDYLKIGAFKKSLLQGYGIYRSDGVIYVAKFKKGAPTGYGYRYENGSEQFVKFKSAKADALSYDQSLQVIAEKQEDGWYKPNGKPLNMKDNAYKGITYVREGYIRIGDVEYYFEPDGYAFYDSDEAEIDWGVTECGYNSILEDGEGTSLYYYYDETGAGSLEGEHRFKKRDGTHWQTFETNIYVN